MRFGMMAAALCAALVGAVPARAANIIHIEASGPILYSYTDVFDPSADIPGRIYLADFTFLLGTVSGPYEGGDVLIVTPTQARFDISRTFEGGAFDFIFLTPLDFGTVGSRSTVIGSFPNPYYSGHYAGPLIQYGSFSGTATIVDDGGYFTGPSFAFSLRYPVPEPATWAMLVVGFGLAGGMMRRKRHGEAKLSMENVSPAIMPVTI